VLEPFGFHPVAASLIENFYFVEGGFKIMGGRSLDFHGHVGLVLQIFGEPDGGKVAPTEFLDD